MATYLGCYSGGNWDSALNDTIACLRHKAASEICLIPYLIGFHTKANIDDFSSFINLKEIIKTEIIITTQEVVY